MPSNITKLADRQPAATATAQLFENWFDPIGVPQPRMKEVPKRTDLNAQEAARKMEAGPPESAFRSRLQTTPSG